MQLQFEESEEQNSTMSVDLALQLQFEESEEQNSTMSELVLLDSVTCEDPFGVSKQLVYSCYYNNCINIEL